MKDTLIKTETVGGEEPGDLVFLITVLQKNKWTRVRITVPKDDTVTTEILDDHKTV